MGGGPARFCVSFFLPSSSLLLWKYLHTLECLCTKRKVLVTNPRPGGNLTCFSSHHPRPEVFSQACLEFLSASVASCFLYFCFLLLLSGLELEFHRFQPLQKLWWALDLEKAQFLELGGSASLPFLMSGFH